MNTQPTTTALPQGTAASRQDRGDGKVVSQKLVTRVAWARRGVREFEEAVNKHLADGWVTNTLSVKREGLRIVCVALLDRC